MRPLIAGNWKMHGMGAWLGRIDSVSASIRASRLQADVLVCIPATLTARFGAVGATVCIIYGGSVEAANARDILDMPGVLIGGARLSTADFDAVLRILT